MGDLAGFHKIVLAWVISALVVEAIYYFTSKRSGFDRSLGKFRIWTVFYIILIFLSQSYISTSGWSPIDPPLEKPIDVVVQELVKNQQQMKAQLQTFKEVLSFMLMITALYLMFAAGVLQQWRNERSKPSAPPVNPRPLGLDLE